MIKILLVEDNEPFRKIFKQMLNDLFPSLAIEEAADGKETMEKVDSFRPGVVFMDIRLPDESGLQLTRKIKIRYPRINVIMLTSYDLPEYRNKATDNGASHYLVKSSLDSEQIKGLIESLLSDSTNSPVAKET